MILSFSREARNRICSLPPEVKKGIKQTLQGLQENPYLGKPLQRELAGFWVVRFKDYRIIYRRMAEENRIMIDTLGRRKNIYQDFAEFRRSKKTVCRSSMTA